MESIFPGVGPNPFTNKPVVHFIGTGRKSDGASSSQSTGGYPAPARSESRPVAPVPPGRGQRVDFTA